MYTLTSLNQPNFNPLFPGKKPKASSTAPNDRSKSVAGSKNTPLFGGRGDAPGYPADDYEFLGLKKLSIARSIKEEIEDDLSDAEYFEQQARKEQKIAAQKQRLSEKLEQKARNSLFHKGKYRQQALQRKESMFLHEDKASVAATQSEIARRVAEKKKIERQELLQEGETLLDYADQHKPRFSPFTESSYTRQGAAYSGYSGGYSGASASASGSVPYQRGTFNPMPDTIFEEEEPAFVPPPKARSHSFSEKSRFVPKQPDNLSDYYDYIPAETQPDPHDRYEEPPFKPFSKNKSHTFPDPRYSEHSPFTEQKHREQAPFSTFHKSRPTPKAPPRRFNFTSQHSTGAGPSHNPHHEYQEKSYPEDFKPREYSERNDGPQTHSRKKSHPTYTPQPPASPPPAKYRHPNEDNFKYEPWMPKSWRLFTANVPPAIQDVYETKELRQLFSTAVQKIIKPEDIKFTTSEENGVKATRVSLKTSKEVFRDWKVKTHSDNASPEEARIFSALGVLFDAGEKAVFEFDKKGQAIKVRRR